MICLTQYLFYEATGQIMKCEGKKCQWYGGDTCWQEAKRKHKKQGLFIADKYCAYETRGEEE